MVKYTLLPMGHQDPRLHMQRIGMNQQVRDLAYESPVDA